MHAFHNHSCWMHVLNCGFCSSLVVYVSQQQQQIFKRIINESNLFMITIWKVIRWPRQTCEKRKEMPQTEVIHFKITRRLQLLTEALVFYCKPAAFFSQNVVMLQQLLSYLAEIWSQNEPETLQKGSGWSDHSLITMRSALIYSWSSCVYLYPNRISRYRSHAISRSKKRSKWPDSTQGEKE